METKIHTENVVHRIFVEFMFINIKTCTVRQVDRKVRNHLQNNNTAKNKYNTIELQVSANRG